MELKIRRNQEIYVIDIQGEVDLYTSFKLKELFISMVDKKIERFIINLEGVDYLDSSGIGALIFISSTIKRLNLKLAITNLRASVKRVMDATRLMEFFPITPTIVEAFNRVKT
jgi:anti-sigma B factor antagonist